MEEKLDMREITCRKKRCSSEVEWREKKVKWKKRRRQVEGGKLEGSGGKDRKAV